MSDILMLKCYPKKRIPPLIPKISKIELINNDT